MSDPAHPRLLDTWHLPGQRTGEDAAYRQNPRCGNRTSWMGARMPLFLPKPVEKGGRYAFAAMGGYGLTVLDVSDPSNLRTVSHLDLPASVSGTEGDNIDVSQYEKTGMIYYSGYPLTEDCYEPYKDVYQIDAKDPENPRVVGVLPRPVPPRSAGITDYCQRRGSFGPKRTGYYTNPGKHDALASSATASTTRACSSSTCRTPPTRRSPPTSCRRRTAATRRSTRTATRPTGSTWSGTGTSPGP